MPWRRFALLLCLLPLAASSSAGFASHSVPGCFAADHALEEGSTCHTERWLWPGGLRVVATTPEGLTVVDEADSSTFAALLVIEAALLAYLVLGAGRARLGAVAVLPVLVAGTGAAVGGDSDGFILTMLLGHALGLPVALTAARLAAGRWTTALWTTVAGEGALVVLAFGLLI